MINEAILEHPAFKSKRLAGTPGYSLPIFKDPICLEWTPQNEPALNGYGITIEGRHTPGTHFYLDRGMAPIKFKLTIAHSTGGKFIIEDGSRLTATIVMAGNNHIFCCGKSGPNVFNLHSSFRGEGCGVFVGRGGTCGHVNQWLEGDGNTIHIGDDVMFSAAIWMRLGDGHGLIEVSSRKIINTPQSIAVGPHVWLGWEAMILQGVAIGAGSIIGARSLVTRDVPPFSVAAGSPAKVVRGDACWTRLANPSEAELDELLGRDYMSGL